MRATVVSVAPNVAGTSLAANLALSATAVPVISARDFPTSGSCLIGGHTLAYTGILYADEDDGVTTDTLTLAAGSPVAGTAYVTAVTLPGSVEYVAQVLRKGADNTESAVIDHALISDDAMKPTAVSDGALVLCERRDGVLYLTKVLGRRAKIRPESITAGTFPGDVVFDGVVTANNLIVPPSVNSAISTAVAAAIAGFVPIPPSGIDGGIL